MILSFIKIRKVPREVLKTSGFALCFQHFPWHLGNVNEWKIIFDPSIILNDNDQKIMFDPSVFIACILLLETHIGIQFL